MLHSRRALVLLAVVILLALAGGARVLFFARARTSTPVAQPQLIFAEFSSTSDQIYVAPADDLGRRTLVTTVEHVDGWGLNPAAGPAGTRVVFTVLPPDAKPQADAPAELWLLDVRTRTKTRLTADADLRVPPVLDSGGKYVVYRASTPGGQQSLVRIELSTGARRPLYKATTAFGIFPVGFARDGSLIYASLSAQGTDFFRLTDGGDSVHLFHASDQLARDWRMSPDGTALAFLAPQLLAERVVYRLQVIRIDGNASPLTLPSADSGTAEQFTPVWAPDGRAITVGREAAPGVSAAASTLPLEAGTSSALTALPAPARGFDSPLAWSPDGSALAVQSFDGTSAANPGNESTVVIENGQRRPVTGRGDIIFFGWVNDG